MKIRQLTFSAVLASLAMAVNTLYAGPPASIQELDWMTGSWAGPVGTNQLEEIWTGTEGGSIAAVVRITGNDATSMFELITIEEVDGSLVLHVQQWDPGFIPRTDTIQEMELAEIGDRTVRFAAVGEGRMRSLGYSSPTPETFIIHIEQAAGDSRDINLQARSPQ